MLRHPPTTSYQCARYSETDVWVLYIKRKYHTLVMDLKLEGVGHMDYCAQGLVLYVDDILDFIKYFT